MHIEKQAFQLSPRFQPVASFDCLQDVCLSSMGAGSGLLPFGLEAKQILTRATRIVTLPTPHSFARTFSGLRSLFYKIPFLLETEILARR